MELRVKTLVRGYARFMENDGTEALCTYICVSHDT